MSDPDALGPTCEPVITIQGGELTHGKTLAAAAHHRASKDGPRLVLLDEAFAGIDPGNRAGCMELIREFDLDFVMTSDRETGCYPALAGNAIYHLSTRPGSMAVLATRQVWNGSAATRPPDHGPAHAEPPEEAAPASGLFADALPRDTDPPADDDDAWEEAP